MKKNSSLKLTVLLLVLLISNIAVFAQPGFPAVSLSANTNSGAENNASQITLTVTANAPVGVGATVTLTVSGANITSSDFLLDYTVQNSVVLTIPQGSTTVSTVFSVNDDALYEGPNDEVATITITDKSINLTFGSPLSQNITIVDNEVAQCHPSNIVYVNASATGANDGSSWANAYTTFQSATTKAVACSTVNQIWVAAGTYKPTTGTDRNISFTMVNNVGIYGGFAGTETAISQRNITNNPTILSGDIGTTGVATDNSYHVISNSGKNNTAILNGFTIQDGYGANSNTFNGYGAGIFNFGGSTPTIKNCTFMNNKSFHGAAILNFGTTAAIVIDSCSFINNTLLAGSNGSGGAIFNAQNTNISISNSTFQLNKTEILPNNSIGGYGGVIYNEVNVTITIDSCLFDQNESEFGGAIVLTSNNNAIINKSTFTNNRAHGGGGCIINESNNTVINNCKFLNNLAQDNISNYGTGGAIQISLGSINIINSIFYNNQAIGPNDDGGGHIMIYGGTVNLINSTLAKGNAIPYGGSVSLINNSCTLNATNCIFSNSTASINGPIIHKRTGTVNLTNCLLDATCPTGVTCGGANIVNANPLYTDYANANLTLQACSRAIDAGTSTGAPPKDIINVSRPQNSLVDIGAYESILTPLPKASIALSATSLNEGATSTNITITVNTTFSVNTDQTVDVTVSGTNITTGDYTLNGATQNTVTITIPNGTTQGTATFNVVDDAITEQTEKVILTLNNPSIGVCVSLSNKDSISITDNDAVAKNMSTNVEYLSLQAAIDAATDGDEITFLIDINEPNISINKSVIIKANGYKLTIPAGNLTIPVTKQFTWFSNNLEINTGTSIINNGTLINKGTIKYQNGTGTYTNAGTYKGNGTFQGNFINNGVLSPSN
jgi:hypothetical protein